jgi:hypothetical protein
LLSKARWDLDAVKIETGEMFEALAVRQAIEQAPI